ncbi:MAG: TerC/Alx family metal homeostasis membrane protein [Candidatus Methanoplasma sp.]|jgi:tellurite resistance protein TerC|nr:TerC/Alx family metal homeostasis membrane protein [Candidatus Methanoplasma sp.]
MSDVMWAIFFVTIAVMFALDLGVLNRKTDVISVKKALRMTAFWITLALAFGILIYFEMGTAAATEYYAAYVVEKMMSVDNLFVFIIIFGYFHVPYEYQHKALFCGIIGALSFRAVFIFAGAELLNTFDWMMYIFGAILIVTAIKTVFGKNENKQEDRLAARLSRRLNVSPAFDKDKLFTVRNGIRMVTPLFICVVMIELTDIMFAFDSIPAVLAISTDTFIIYTSNMFAVLGLRSLYFAIKGFMTHMEYLKYGLGAILAFVGIKMFVSDYYHIDVLLSLAFILAVLAVTVLFSLYMRKRSAAPGPE